MWDGRPRPSLDSCPPTTAVLETVSWPGPPTLLEIAIGFSRRAKVIKPQNTMRFAWWGAEESGLVGSTNYVNGLSQAEQDKIALYLNFDMVGSPNYIIGVYDANESTYPAPVEVPPGSRNQVQLEDWRLVLGARKDQGWGTTFLEVGYVFNREVEITGLDGDAGRHRFILP